MRTRRIAVIATFMVVASAVAASAQNLTVTDTKGTVVELRNARLDYTSYSFIYTYDFEPSGIRAYQGNGVITISWSRIDTITIARKKTDATPWRLEGEILFVDKTQRPIEFVIPSNKGLFGQTDLGEFSIALDQGGARCRRNFGHQECIPRRDGIRLVWRSFEPDPDLGIPPQSQRQLTERERLLFGANYKFERHKISGWDDHGWVLNGGSSGSGPDLPKRSLRLPTCTMRGGS